jgi:hypothetical protein
MHKVTLQSGTYAVDDALQGFDIIEKPSSNVAFVATCMITNKMYVQFKYGSGYMYSEVDLDTLSAVSAVDSIGKFISSKVVKHFPSAKMEKPLIHPLVSVEITGFDEALAKAGQTLSVDRKAVVVHGDLSDNQEPEF